MRKLLMSASLLLLIVAFSGCSMQTMYIIRNGLHQPVEIFLTIKGAESNAASEDWELSSAEELVPLKKSDLANSFKSKITGRREEGGTRKFVLPPGNSIDISRLIQQLSPTGTTTNDFNGSKIEIRFGESVLLFGNHLNEVHQIFKFKSFFWGGPLVYYLDLE